MNITYRSILILKCIAKLNGERTVYGIYHLLNGKKSSQTIGDANLFDLTNLFGILKPLDREQFNKEIITLQQFSLINEIAPSSNKFIINTNGYSVLNRKLERKPIPNHLNGWKYNDSSQLLWRRISLLTQVLSNLIDEKKRYTPIQHEDTVIDWVKEFLMKSVQNRYIAAETLYNEVLQSLEMVSELEATIFVMRLTSSTRIGYTIEQISSLLNEDETWCQILFLHTLHTIVKQLETNGKKFPILVSMIAKEHHHNVLLTASTKTTYHMLIQGKTIDEIADVRNLKRNTIEDHVVEVTHQNSEFLIDPFVSPEHQQMILSTYQTLQTKQLRPLKEKLSNDISYFEIRLVLARIGDIT
ncbi:helix-turn-helix domain-containing protein [Bacillus sp. REN16]|uniref:helix-turn-helix domain-containing protein n=1 Tax=Bacillus sp. REN16 TaxID=2887296 RepID=UPI001E2B216D|nr:helix-turn-helix domain-containing protein [Bacillus sp. REN16]MCC3358285.1 helix-turn-helix domain-containing protein [Bacillus sp. REN16]